MGDVALLLGVPSLPDPERAKFEAAYRKVVADIHESPFVTDRALCFQGGRYVCRETQIAWRVFQATQRKKRTS